jgi:hypothetical protein
MMVWAVLQSFVACWSISVVLIELWAVEAFSYTCYCFVSSFWLVLSVLEMQVYLNVDPTVACCAVSNICVVPQVTHVEAVCEETVACCAVSNICVVPQVTHVEAMCEETDSIKMLLDLRAGDWGQSHGERPNVAVSLYSVALNCIEDSKRKRPNMTVVLERLEEIVGSIT